MKAVLFAIVDIEHRCALGAVLGEIVDHVNERNDAHAVISSPWSC